MDIKKAKSFLEEMIELCNQLEDEVLTDACSGIYKDVIAAKSVETLLSLAREIMVFSSEAPWSELGMDDIRDEVEKIFNKILEEYEEF